MNVYLILEVVDLGDHVIGVYANKEHAEKVCGNLNYDARQKQIDYSIETYGYVKEDILNNATQYYIEEFKLEE